MTDQKSLTRLAFMGVFVTLLFQFFVAKYYEEPYPAVVLPGFGQVPDISYPYPYERLHLYAYTPNDSVELTLDEVFDPFPEVALFAPMRVRLKAMADTLTATTGNPQEQELLHYVRKRINQRLREEVQRLDLVFYQYQAEADGKIHLMDTHRKILYF